MKQHAGDKDIPLEINSQVYTTLASILSAQIEVLEELTRLGEQKTAAITSEEPRQLEEVAAAELAQVEQLNRWEQQRLRLIGAVEQQAAQLLGHDMRFTLQDLIQLASVSEQRTLQEFHSRLDQLAQRLEQVSALNQKLLAHSLAVVNFSLEVLTGSQQTAPTYDRPGRGKGAKTSARVLDAKA